MSYEPDLDINQLHEIHVEREKNKRLVFETIYLRCREKILYTNNVKHKTVAWYRIPSIIWGLPLYNVQACAAYLIYRLRLQNFEVSYHSPNMLYIDWSMLPEDVKAAVASKEIDKQLSDKDKDKDKDDGPVVLHGLSRLHRAAQRLKYGNRSRCPSSKIKY